MQHKMKVILSLAAALLTTAGLLAQAPVNDAFNCATMIDFGVAPHCTSTIYTNENATPSIIATVDTVSCFNSAVAQRDVWFKFTCSDTLYDYRITIKAAGIDPIVNPEIALLYTCKRLVGNRSAKLWWLHALRRGNSAHPDNWRRRFFSLLRYPVRFGWRYRRLWNQ